MDCVVLECHGMPGGSRLNVFPLAATLCNGEKLICKKALAKNLIVQYPQFLKEGGELERDTLAQGNWEVAKKGPPAAAANKGPGAISSKNKAVKPKSGGRKRG